MWIYLHDTSVTTFTVNVDAIDYFEDVVGENNEFLFSNVYMRCGRVLVCDESSEEIVRLIEQAVARS